MTFNTNWDIFLFVFGLINSIVTSVREIPQIVKIVRNQSGRDVSYWSVSLIITYCAFWVAYGALIQNWILFATDIFMILSMTIILTLKVIFSKIEDKADERDALKQELLNLYLSAENQNNTEIFPG